MQNREILTDALGAFGYSVHLLHLGGDKRTFMQITNSAGPCLTLSANSPLYPFPSASSRLICKDKSISADFALELGISCPESVLAANASDGNQAHLLLEKYGKLIVKPAKSSLSSGLTMDITTQEQLSSAVSDVLMQGDRALIQQQVAGDELRFVAIGGKVRAAMLRQTARVTGDGVKTIQDLIKEENKRRKQIRNSMVAYPLLDKSLVGEGLLNSNDAPKKGDVIELNRHTMIARGASVYNVLTRVHTDYVSIAETLAKPLGAGFVAVDLIIRDYTQPAAKDNHWFLEFNLCPALKLFYSCRDGKQFRVAHDYLAPMIDTVIQRGTYA